MMDSDSGNSNSIGATKEADKNSINDINNVTKMRTILMMSTAIIQPLAPVYGTPVVAYTLKAYLEAGWDIHFIAGFRPEPVDSELAKQLSISWFDGPLLSVLRTIGERVRKVGFFARILWWVIAQFKFFLKGYRIISQHKIDLVYSWDVSSAPAAWILSRLFRIPWVARYLGTFFPQGEEKLLPIRYWREILAYKLPADMVIMTNDGTQGDKALQKLGVDMGKVEFLLNGVDKKPFLQILTT